MVSNPPLIYYKIKAPVLWNETDYWDDVNESLWDNHTSMICIEAALFLVYGI